MYILYIDESGNEDDPADRYFVLGGVAVYERTTFFLSNSLEEVQHKHFPAAPPVDFHASAMRSGKGFWRNVAERKRKETLDDVVSVIANANDPGVVLFAAAIEKHANLYGEKAVEYAAAELCRRFDLFLMRRHQNHNDTQRGLLVFAEGRFHQRAKLWVRGFREFGTRWGILRNLSDIPYFASAKESRLLQAADCVAHSVFLLYERRDSSLLKSFLHRFDQDGGTLHGLVHYRASTAALCDCPACVSRNMPGQFGNWL